VIARGTRTWGWLLVVGLVAGCGSAGDVGDPEGTGVASTESALKTVSTLDVQAIYDPTTTLTEVKFNTPTPGQIEHYVIKLRDESGKLVLLEVSPPGLLPLPDVQRFFIQPHVGNFVSVQAKLGKGTPGGGDIGAIFGKGGIYGKGTPGGGDINAEGEAVVVLKK